MASELDLSSQYRTAPRLLALTSERIGTCSGESGKVFKGDYRSIDLHDCSNITISNARVGRLTVLNSRLNLIDSDILGKEEGLHADNSDVTITNSNISGVIAIKAENSRFDLAGVLLNGSQDAVRGINSKFLFSISEVHSLHMNGSLHTYKKMVDEVL